MSLRWGRRYRKTWTEEKRSDTDEQKTATAVAMCMKGSGIITVNKNPLNLVEPELLRYKVYEPILLLGRERFDDLTIRVRVQGGGQTAQIYGGAQE